MEKLTIALVLAFSTVVALGAAHTTIVTTIEDNYPVSKQQECSPQLLGQNLNQCHMYIMKQGENPQQCCQELENMEEECQCEAVKQVLRDAVQQVHQQQQGQQQQDGQEAGWPFSTASEQIQRFQVRANMLGNKCSLSRQCLIRSTATTATTIDNNRKWDWPVSAQECQIQSVNRCQRYVEQHISASPNTPPTSSSRQEQQEYCDAIEKLNRKFIRQPRQQQVGHQGGPFGGQQKCNGEFGRHQSGHFGGQQQQGGEYGQQSAQFGGQQQQGGEFGGHQSGRFGGQQQQDGEFGGNQSGQFGGQQKQGGKFGQQNGQFGGQQQQGGEFGGQFGGQQQL